MIGTWINVVGILLGGIAGMTFARNLSAAAQLRLRRLLVGLTVYAGFGAIWRSLQAPPGHAAGQLAIALVALSVGSALGRVLGLQRAMNRAGQWARERFARATAAERAGVRPDAVRRSDGFITCTLLFCVSPLAVVGPVQDGLNGDWQALAAKGLLDGLATMGFVASFGWSPLLAAVPVLAFQGLITVGAHALGPWLGTEAARDSVGITGGFIVATLSLVILDLRKVPLANYLPALVLAPLLARWWQ